MKWLGANLPYNFNVVYYEDGRLHTALAFYFLSGKFRLIMHRRGMSDVRFMI